MIRITKGQANTVVVTTTEKGTASHYLFSFYSRSKKTTVYCVQQDSSSYTDRYNVFQITETDTPTATNGEVSLDAGEYEYKIYANSSSSNLDPDGLTLLERGMAKVTGTTTAPTEYDSAETYTEYVG